MANKKCARKKQGTKRLKTKTLLAFAIGVHEYNKISGGPYENI